MNLNQQLEQMGWGHLIQSNPAEIAQLFTPPRLRPLSQWADEEGWVNTGPARGKWKTICYQRAIMDALTDPEIEVVVWMKPTQVGATEIMSQLIAGHARMDPTDILISRPTEDLSRTYANVIIEEMFRDNPFLRGLMPENTEKSGKNTRLLKVCRNGLLLDFVSAGKPSDGREKVRRVYVGDEIDDPSYGESKEGSVLKNFINRTESYANRKVYLCSSPTTEEDSRVEPWFKMTNQQKYHINCLHCGHPQVLSAENIQATDYDSKTASLVCIHCGAWMHHRHKFELVERGQWIPTATGRRGYSGFWCDKSISYLPNAQWPNIMEDKWKAEKDPALMISFLNTTLAKTAAKEQVVNVDAEELQELRERLQAGRLPDGALVVTIGIDVQRTWFHLDVMAWGLGQTGWHVFSAKIDADTADMDAYRPLKEYMKKEWTGSSGLRLKADLTVADSGDGSRTANVYEFVRQCRLEKMLIVASKGGSTLGLPVVGAGKYIDYTYKNTRYERGAMLYIVGTIAAKDLMYGRAKMDRDQPGALHFTDASTNEWLDGFTSEVKINGKNTKRGGDYYVKKTANARNEPVDCVCMAYVGLLLVMRRYPAGKFWGFISQRAQRRIEGEKASPAALPQPMEGDEMADLQPPARDGRPARPSRRSGRLRAGVPGGRDRDASLSDW